MQRECTTGAAAYRAVRGGSGLETEVDNDGRSPMWTRNVLVAGVAGLALLGCYRVSDDVGPTEHVVSSFEGGEALSLPGDIAPAPSPGGPASWPQTSAAYPTGWADAAERRCSEGFCEAAPTAIGGGPQ